MKTRPRTLKRIAALLACVIALPITALADHHKDGEHAKVGQKLEHSISELKKHAAELAKKGQKDRANELKKRIGKMQEMQKRLASEHKKAEQKKAEQKKAEQKKAEQKKAEQKKAEQKHDKKPQAKAEAAGCETCKKAKGGKCDGCAKGKVAPEACAAAKAAAAKACEGCKKAKGGKCDGCEKKADTGKACPAAKAAPACGKDHCKCPADGCTKDGCECPECSEGKKPEARRSGDRAQAHAHGERERAARGGDRRPAARPAVRRGGPQGGSKEMHIRIALHHLRAAGLGDIADRIEAHAKPGDHPQQGRQAHPQRGGRPGPDTRDQRIGQAIGGLRKDVEQLKAEIAKLKQACAAPQSDEKDAPKQAAPRKKQEKQKEKKKEERKKPSKEGKGDKKKEVFVYA